MSAFARVEEIGVDGLRERAAAGTRVPRWGRPATATAILGPDWSGLPAPAELAALLTRAPVGRVVLSGTADFSVLPGRAAARVVALVRECAAIGVPLAWSLTLGADQAGLVRLLDHLPAPERVTVLGRRSPLPVEWRSTCGFGLLHFRKGPGFLSLVDSRADRVRRTVVDDPVAVDAFLRALEGCPWSEVDSEQARRLVDSGLLARFGDHCVTLPVHMRAWPLGAALLGGTLASAGKKPEA